MFFYYALFFVFYCLGIKAYLTDKDVSTGVMSIILAIVSYFVACRVDVGADWAGYVSFYYYKEIGEGRDFLEIEPLFRLSRDIMFNCGLSHQGFLFFFSFLSLMALVFVAKKFRVTNVSLVLLVYIALFFCHNQLNVLRTCIMASFVWVGFSCLETNLKKSILYILLGAGFHIIAIVYIPLLFLINRYYSKKTYLIIIIVSLVLIIFSFGTMIIDHIPVLSSLGRASNYLDPESHFREQEYGISLGYIFNIVICLFFRYKYNNEYQENGAVKIVLNIFLVNLFLVGFLNGFPVLIERVCSTMNFALCFIWPCLLSHVQGKNKWYWIIPFTVYLILFYNKSFNTVDVWGDNCLVPFKFEIASFFR